MPLWSNIALFMCLGEIKYWAKVFGWKALLCEIKFGWIFFGWIILGWNAFGWNLLGEMSLGVYFWVKRPGTFKNDLNSQHVQESFEIKIYNLHQFHIYFWGTLVYWLAAVSAVNTPINYQFKHQCNTEWCTSVQTYLAHIS